MTKDKKKTILYYILSAIVLIAVFFIALSVGRYTVSASSFFKVIFGGDADTVDKSVVLSLRLPRTIVALLVGIALSLSGLVYQETFQNKLVSPDFLGVSTGSGFGASVAIILGATGILISLTAFVFGIVTML